MAERARDLAVMLTVGSERRWVLSLVLAEAAVLGTIGSILGVGLGIGLARLMTTLVAQSMGAIYLVRFPIDALSLSGVEIARAIAFGIGAAVVATVFPARKASRIDPIALMRFDHRERMAVGSSNLQMLAVGAAVIGLAIVAVIIERAERSIAWGNVGAMLWWAAGLLLSIPAMSAIAALCQRPLTRWFGAAGRIAAAGLRRAPAWTGVTVGVIALSLTVAVSLRRQRGVSANRSATC
jgi:putative ABC transport system permease protein